MRFLRQLIQLTTIMTDTVTQSAGLSTRHLNMYKEGRTLVDDSNISEGNLKTAVDDILTYAKECIQPYGGNIQYFTKISIDDLVAYMNDPSYQIGSSKLDDTNTTNSRTSIRPDAGIILWNYNGQQFPLYIGEDKVQGTNDKLFANGKPRQATGNAIERYFKNVRAEEMLCSHVPYFPSIVFASGCDFHHSETISTRLCAGNYGRPNHYTEITKEKTQMTLEELDTVCNSISIDKISFTKFTPLASIPTVCIKAHKWDEMPHNSSLWKPHEYLELSNRVITLAVDKLINTMHIQTNNTSRTNSPALKMKED